MSFMISVHPIFPLIHNDCLSYTFQQISRIPLYTMSAPWYNFDWQSIENPF